MSHGDTIFKTTKNFLTLLSTKQDLYACIKHKKKKLYGIQFHPEVHHTINGTKILKNFLIKIAKIIPKWISSSMINSIIEKIKKTVKTSSKIILALSGGVDSTITAHLIHKEIGNKLICIFIDHGLLRLNEKKEINYHFSQKFEFRNFRCLGPNLRHGDFLPSWYTAAVISIS